MQDIKRKKYTIRFVTTIICSLVVGCAQADGINQKYKNHLLESFKKHEVKMAAKASKGEAQLEVDIAYCADEYNYSLDPVCLENKYMSDGYYILDITFWRDSETPVEPEADMILGGQHPLGEAPFDTAAREAFIVESADAVLREYLGEDYQKFNSAELIAVNSRAVIVKLQIRSSEELELLLEDRRLLSIHHIGSPTQPLEEIAN